MRGGAQSHLMRCADGRYYVVKFQNNPQHTRVLVNDWLGTRLGEMIGLPMPAVAVMDVHPWLVERTPDLRIEMGGQRTMFTAGLSFGSRYRGVADRRPGVGLPAGGHDATSAQRERLSPARSRSTNGRATPTGARQPSGSWRASASLPPASSIRVIASTPASGIFPTRRCAASSGATMFMHVSHRGTASSRGSSRIENFPESSLWPLAEEIPPEWYGAATDELERLLSRLLTRRARVRELIQDFKNSSRNPFPNWKER